MKMQRRNFYCEFKLEAARLVREGGVSMSRRQITSELVITDLTERLKTGDLPRWLEGMLLSAGRRHVSANRNIFILSDVRFDGGTDSYCTAKLIQS